MMDVNKKYSYLIYKKLQHKISSKEEEELSRWLQKDEQNLQHFEQLRKVLSEGEKFELPSFSNKETIWDSIAAETFKKVNIKEESSGLIELVTSAFHTRKLLYAACLIFLLVLVFAGKSLLFNPYKTVIAEKGERKTIKLADGSSFLLNSDSKVTYKKNFATEDRTLNLSGEAYFEVKQGVFPFIVTTANSKTTVTGTAFNITARDNQTRIFVKEGTVRFATKSEENIEVLLSSNQLSMILDKQQPTSPETGVRDKFLGWLENKLVFDKTPLSHVVDELERFYNVKIKISEPELKKRTITATIHKLTFEEAIASICKTLNIDYKKQAGTYTICN